MEECSDQLAEEEIVTACDLILIVRRKTTVHLISGVILAILHRPWPVCRIWVLTRNLALVVIEETLRYDLPVQLDGEPQYKPNITLCELSALALT
ncbi:hypothetical protein [Mycobacterium uberis]|uniref:hypothetical protein n=1 Tax=Mycobacterium uberis TaxID=2162698 RepID=UPI000E30A46B|nr:hypothetical protein [Mycobacterium uberis]